MKRAAVDTPGMRVLVRSDREEASLWRRLRSTGQSRLREHLFDRYRRFASALARRHARRFRSAPDVLDDLEQFAYRGLLEAIDRYDPVKGPPFLSFATTRIGGSIADGMAKLDEWGALARYHRRARRERVTSLTEHGQDAGNDGASATDRLADVVTELALGLMLEADRAAASAGADRSDNGFDTLAWRQTQEVLRMRVEQLPTMERMVIVRHYQQDLSFADIARIAGMSRGRVSQIHQAALAKLRKSMRILR